MDNNEAIKILTEHQRWRIGEEEEWKYTPKQITEAINIVLDIANKYNNTKINLKPNLN